MLLRAAARQARTFSTQEADMLSTAPVVSILPVIDMRRAREFYERKLGLKPIGEKPNGQYFFATGSGSQIALYEKAGGTRAEHTALGFEVEDIEGEVTSLEKAGVVFEDYDLPELKTVNHICSMAGEKAAWFKDTEGNFLCIHQTLH
jgi:catechol 2,3-dioxygenase-like lactoylglutathione lyase family enzyme